MHRTGIILVYDKWCDTDVEKFNLDSSQTSQKRKKKIAIIKVENYYWLEK